MRKFVVPVNDPFDKVILFSIDSEGTGKNRCISQQFTINHSTTEHDQNLQFALL